MKPNLSLYLIADTEVPTRLSFLQTIEEAIIGGVTVVQLRSKKKSHAELSEIARSVRLLTLKYYIPFIINDNVQLAGEIGADGVHLGQSDVSIEQARTILGSKRVIGISIHNPAEARDAEAKGANYIGAGTVFPTTSKGNIIGIIGVKGLKEIRQSTNLPIVAIGGIDISNAASVIKTGVNGIAVISSIMKSDSPKETAQHFRAIIAE